MELSTAAKWDEDFSLHRTTTTTHRSNADNNVCSFHIFKSFMLRVGILLSYCIYTLNGLEHVWQFLNDSQPAYLRTCIQHLLCAIIVLKS